MKVDNAVYPTGEQLGQAVASGSNGPIVMVNLLKFKNKSSYKDGRADDATGAEAYQRYGAPMLKFVTERGGRVIYYGQVKSLVIGGVEELWDAVALVEYPSSEAFVKIAMSSEVAEIGVHREAGLAGQLLIQSVQAATP